MNVTPAREPQLLAPERASPRRHHSEERRILEQSLRTGIFRDPPSKRALVPPAELLTAAHAQLIEDLRTEAARVSFDNMLLKDKADTFERRYRTAKLDRVHIKEQLSLVQGRYQKLERELESSQHLLQQIDELFSGERTQRMARALSLPGAELEAAELISQMSPTPRFEFRNPFED